MQMVRGRLASQRWIGGALWVEAWSSTRCTSGSAGTLRSICSRKARNSVAVPLGSADYGAGLHVERGDRSVVPWQMSSWVWRATWPGRIGGAGAVPSVAWICSFSSTHSTRARSGGFYVPGITT